MILQVIVDISNSEVDRTFDYIGDDIPIGSRVAVEFGKKHLIGFVVGKKDSSDYDNLKTAKYLDTPIGSDLLELLSYMRKEYNLRYIDALRLFVPAKLRDERDPQSTRTFLTVDTSRTSEELTQIVGARAPRQLDALMFLSANGGQYLSVMNAKFGVAAVKGLREKGVVVENAVHERQTPLSTLRRQDKRVELTSDQRRAVNAVMNGNGVFLLHGVTGSGKTEVYESIIEQMLARGKTAIMLVPEISLTPQVLGLFRARFSDNVAILHSGLNASERYDEWKRLKDGDAKIAIGARSGARSA